MIAQSLRGRTGRGTNAQALFYFLNEVWRDVFTQNFFSQLATIGRTIWVGWHDGGKSEMDAGRKAIHPITCHTFISKCVHPLPDSFQRSF